MSIGECMVEFAQTGAGAYHQGFAGDTFNTAWHVRRDLGPGWRVGYFTALGTDIWSDRLLAFMAAEGIETDHIVRLPGRAPGIYVIDHLDGERRVSYWRETSAARALADDPEALEAAIGSANALFFSGITLAILAPDARGQLLSALDRAKARGATVAFDSKLRPGLWPDRGTLRAAIRSAARVSTIALPTLPSEAELFGEKGAEAVAERYQQDGCPEVVVRNGSEPALVVWKGGRARVAPERRPRPLDSTGAGDSFNGAYLAARVMGVKPEEAAHRAHDAAADTDQAHGALA
ncbi:MAG: sugar kinase [Paracoccaceae bacterium]|nr:sugar kinase [Paracoccaceae bacterium]